MRAGVRCAAAHLTGAGDGCRPDGRHLVRHTLAEAHELAGDQLVDLCVGQLRVLRREVAGQGGAARLPAWARREGQGKPVE
jgi:hypothetical protein